MTCLARNTVTYLTKMENFVDGFILPQINLNLGAIRIRHRVLNVIPAVLVDSCYVIVTAQSHVRDQKIKKNTSVITHLLEIFVDMTTT